MSRPRGARPGLGHRRQAHPFLGLKKTSRGSRSGRNVGSFDRAIQLSFKSDLEVPMEIECLRAHVQSGERTFPIYIGFARAVDIAAVSVAPAFDASTTNQQIAENISVTPVRDWQRPLAEHRVEAIADAFSNNGALMPNPVLLANNAFVSGAVKVENKQVGSFPTSTYTVTIDETPVAADKRPLWILDGQHRIGGLSRSAQKENLVPLVLLLSDPAGQYSPPDLAKIFAQVTTAAEKLDELHNEWLTFAFDLGRYASAGPDPHSAKQAFRAVVELCKTPSWGSDPNPFFNRVQFNSAIPVHAEFGGFAYKCRDLAHLFLKHYYSRPANSGHMEPSEVAREIARAYSGLHSAITNHDSSVFFAQETSKQQFIMQEAYVIGILSRALAEGSTPDYRALLHNLNFHNTNWDFSWIRSLSARANAISRRIAIDVLDRALTTGQLPSGSLNLADHLRGNGAKVQLAFSKISPAGNPIAAGRIEHEVLRGSTTSISVGTNPYVKLLSTSSNVGEVVIHDAHAPLKKYGFGGRGMSLADPLPKPLNILVQMYHYGDLSNQAGRGRQCAGLNRRARRPWCAAPPRPRPSDCRSAARPDGHGRAPAQRSCAR